MQVCVLSSGLNDHGSVPAMGTVLRFITTSIPRVCGLPSVLLNATSCAIVYESIVKGSDCFFLLRIGFSCGLV